jgi:hypothetical protein
MTAIPSTGLDNYSSVCVEDARAVAWDDTQKRHSAEAVASGARADGGPYSHGSSPEVFSIAWQLALAFESGAHAHPALERRCYGLARRYSVNKHGAGFSPIVVGVFEEGLVLSPRS